jgi:hypothetical protein
VSNREAALALARRHFDGGAFTQDLARRVALRTASQDPASQPVLRAYLEGDAWFESADWRDAGKLPVGIRRAPAAK